MENLEPAFVGVLDFRSGVFVRRFDMAMAVYTLSTSEKSSKFLPRLPSLFLLCFKIWDLEGVED